MKVKECGCPEIVDRDWDLTEHTWTDKAFYRIPLAMIMHTPIGMGKKIEKAMAAIKEKGYKLSEPPMIVSKDGFFKGAVMIGIERPAEFGPEVVLLPKIHLISKVFVGPWKQLGRGISELLSFVRSKEDTQPKAIYFWYVSCLQCVKDETELKTVILAEL